ncbi:MAG TPA: Na+:solute symporter [Sedimentisphaerales bacterium]|nr:Na+:solute symporter [Sedimentisphaerales bacterium]
MNIHGFDIAIIIAYFVTVIVAGILVSRKAGENMESYFLANKSIPWYVLGVSNAASMFDITGTMWLVMLLFVYGLKSVWLPWLWPMFNQIFLMVYLAVWLRRSNVLTGAEWIRTRFGDDKGGELSHISVVIFALISVVGFIAYSFQGIGKFLAVFFPWEISPNVYALIIMAVTTVYVILGGMHSVVITDIIQYIIMTVVSVFVAAIAMNKTTPEMVFSVVPQGWKEIFFGWHLNLDWSNILASVNNKIAGDGFAIEGAFGAFFMMMLFKGVLVSMAGPCPNYDMQRILATKTPKESALMSGIVSLVLFFPRYLLIAGIVVLGLVFYSPQLQTMGSQPVDYEQLLPYVINNFIPAGLTGLVIAGLLAAFMSTFDSTINAGAAYIVNDLYKRYINPNASDKRYIYISYICSIIVVVVGISFGFVTDSINSVTQWLVAGLFGGYTAPNVLKWHWWRLNGMGYFAGMMSGIITALAVPLLLPGLHILMGFLIILTISTAASIILSLITKPESPETLQKFYKTVRPWGFWTPVLKMVLQNEPDFKRNTNFNRDMLNVAVGIAWQTCLITLPIYLVLKQYKPMAITIAILIITSIFLKINWYNKLEEN